MEPFIAALLWILYLVLELRQDILIAFAYADAPLFLLGLILYLRVRRQRRQKEQSKMGRKRSTEAELFDAMVGLAEPAVKAAEQAIPLLDYAVTSLPDLEKEGHVRRFRDVLVASSRELKKQLTVALGPATIRGVKKNVELIWDAIAKTEEIRLAAKLRKDKHAIAASEVIAGLEVSLETQRQAKTLHDLGGKILGYKPELFISAEGWGNAFTNSVHGAVARIYISQLGLDDSWQPEYIGERLLSPPKHNTVALSGPVKPSPNIEADDSSEEFDDE